MTLDPADTIAAIASPPGPGLRGVIRLSGPRAWEVALVGFHPSDDERLPDRSRNRTRKVTGFYRLEGLRPPLPATLLFWSGPRSYTGQDAAEVHTLGSRPLLEHLLSHFLMQDARGAEPGEFTLRAFLSGRIDLTQAEAVLGVIDARSPAQLTAALDQLGGGLATPLKSLRDRLLDVLAHLEANLDFNDEPDVDELGRAELSESLAQGAQDLAVLADQLKGRERPDGFPKVVLVGPPNAGKSRLFNALLGFDRAIVSPVAGTTRDYLSASCECDGLIVELIDTAGAEEAHFPIEARAQAFRSEQASLADLLIVCEAEDLATTPSPPLPDRPHLLVRTKCDLAEESVGWVSEAKPTKVCSGVSLLDPEVPPGGLRFADPPYRGAHSRHLPSLATSAATGEGLDELRRAIAETLRAQFSEDDLTTTTGARCRESLVRASDSLARAADAIAIDAGDELVAADLRQSLDDLGRVVGVVVTDDILDRIFRRFCIGK